MPGATVKGAAVLMVLGGRGFKMGFVDCLEFVVAAVHFTKSTERGIVWTPIIASD
jgi:hypothetical protein